MATRDRCAFCGRDLNEEPDAIQAGDLWFCSRGHLLDYEARAARPRRSRGRFVAAGVATALVAAVIVFSYVSGRHPPSAAPAFENGSPTPSLIVTTARPSVMFPTRFYSQSIVVQCLKSHGVQVTDSGPASGEMPPVDKLPGLMGGVDFDSASPPMDDGSLLFMRSPALARAHFEQTLDAWRHLLTIDITIPGVPKQHVSNRRLAQLRGNVFVLWILPRRYPAASTRLLQRCLDASQRKF